MRLITVTCALAVLAACAGSDDPSQPITDTRGVPQTALASRGHSLLRPDVDTIALQRLLAAVPYSSRDVVLSSFELVPGEMRDLSFEDRAQDQLAGAVYKQSDLTAAAQPNLSRVEGEGRVRLWNRPVLLALAVDAKLVPNDGVLVLRSARWDYDVVLLGKDAANVHGLDAGLRAVYSVRLHDGLRPRSNRVGKLQLRSSFSSQARGGNLLPRSWNTYLESKLSAARNAGVRVVPGLGPLRATDFVVVNR